MLAEKLCQPVWYLQQTMPQNEFLQWMSYYRNKRPDIQEQQMAVLTTVATNAMGGKRKVEDFLISRTKSDKPKPMKADAIKGVFGGMLTNKA